MRARGTSAIALVGLWLVVVPACGSGTAPERSSATHTEADPHQLVSAGATLLDVRTPGEYEAAHLEGALLVPVDELEDRLAEIPRDAPVVVYCRSGNRSARASDVLREAGYEVHDLGAMSNW